MKTVILVNVGTPQSPQPQDVGVYLNEFLMDENIISIPRPFRDLLVKGIIVPKRKHLSAEKYKKIWTSQGSPLMVHSENLKNKLQLALGDVWNVRLGMQVGSPSLASVLKESEGHEIYFCPLYPQYATATTGGALGALRNRRAWILKPFFNENWFIQAQAHKIREKLRPTDHLLLSYHGLPVSQLKAVSKTCYQNAICCMAQNACEKNCYKAHCLKTTELLVRELGHTSFSTSFQSRLGPARWIEPSTAETVQNLLRNGVKHLKVVCPSFVADCLETLEEIGIELRSQFLQQGGESFELISCVNDDEVFVKGLTAKLLENDN